MRDLQLISKAPIFRGIDETEIETVLSCMNVKTKMYKKDEYIVRYGEVLPAIGLMVSGSAIIVEDDFWGNRNILHKIAPSEVFGEAYACAAGAETDICVVAETECAVIWLDAARIMSTCPSACSHHNKIIKNLISELARKNLRQKEKLVYISQRSTRAKVLAYLFAQSQKHNSREFDITFNRQQLADYLAVERSALSAELSKLRNEKLIDFVKNHFVLYGRV